MWIIYALLAGFLAGLTAILSKISINKIDTNVITFVRTIIILISMIIIVVFFKLYINSVLTLMEIIYIVLSGGTTALMWLTYFKSLFYGDINKVTPIEKSSIVLTLIISCCILGEKITINKIFSIIFIISGVLLMTKKSDDHIDNNKWILYSILTAFFNSLTTIISKYGLNEVNSNISTLLRTVVVFIIIFIIVLYQRKFKDIKKIRWKNLMFIILSGITTTLSWLFYFKSLQNGSASVVFSLEKSSIVFIYLMSVIFLKEKICKKSIFGLLIIIIGIIILTL